MALYLQRSDAVIGYKADADIFCPACAALIYDRIRPDGVLGTVADQREAFRALDNEGNEVSPVFAGEAGNFPEGLLCGRCGYELVEAEVSAIEEDDDPLLDFGDQAYGAS